MIPKSWLLLGAVLSMGCGTPSPEKLCARAAELSQDVSQTECQALLEQEQRWDPVVYKTHAKCIMAAKDEASVAECLPTKPKQDNPGTVASTRAPTGEPSPKATVAPSPGARTCEQAREAYLLARKEAGPPPSTANDSKIQSILNKGTYLQACGVPGSMSVDVCAAIQDGAVTGVTVKTVPPDARIAACIDGKIRALQFPSDPALSIAYTKFSAP